MLVGMRRWWGQYGTQVLVSCFVLGTAWSIRQTQGVVLSETYHWLTFPFHGDPDQLSQIESSVDPELRAQVSELQHQNQELRRLLGLKQQLGQNSLSAPVVGRSADHWWQQMTLGRGSQDGVKVGDIVTAPGGLVGRVDSVTPHTSRILLISDSTSRVGVVVSRGRFMGVLRGDGSQEAILEFFDKEPRVQVGDNVFTSGLSSLFPAGIMVGRIRSVNLNSSPAPQAVVELTSPLSMLEWALIYGYEQGS